MKKITAFFLAILPFFLTILMFILGFSLRHAKTIDVTDVWFTQDSYVVKKEDESEMEYQLNHEVIPMNASNPEVFYYVPEEGQNVVQIDNTGLATCKGYGETNIYIFSKERPQQVYNKATFKVTDDKYHSIEVLNESNASYLAHYETLKLDVKPIPAATDVKHDPTIEYWSSDPTIVSVTADGELQAHDKDGKVVISVFNQASGISKSIEVEVNKGVYLVDYDDPSTKITSSSKVDLASELVTYPDTEARTKTENFTWTSSNDQIATVVDGKVSFKQPGEVDITVAYKRNPEWVYSTKKVRSSCGDLYDVNFNKYSYTTTADKQSIDISYCTFPLDNQQNLKITSSNILVVEPKLVDGKYTFKVKGTGKAILTASIPTADGEITDTCVVTVNNAEGTSLIKDKEVSTGSYYYSIRDNIDIDSIDQSQTTKIEMTDENSVASLDETNGIVHFKQAGVVKIKLTNKSTSSEFTLTSTGSDNKKIDAENTIHLQVGTQYAFNDGWVPEFGSYADKFDVTTEGIIFKDITAFIPKSGGKLQDIILTHSFEHKYVTIIIEEKPIEINFEGYNKGIYPTYDKNFNLKEKVLASSPIIPSTACKADGTPYSVKTEYNIDPEVGYVENDVIKFKQKGVAIVDLLIENQPISHKIVVGSTFGDVGKFELVDKDSKSVASGETVSVDENAEVILSLTSTNTGLAINQELFDAIKENIKISNTSVSVTPTFDAANSKINFTIKGLEYGSSLVAIQCKTFVYYLNVNVSSTIQNFYLYFKGNIIAEDTNTKFFTNKDLKFNIIVSPISSSKKAEGQYKIFFDGTELTGQELLMVDLTGKLDDAKQHKLLLQSTLDTTIKNEFTLQYQEDITADDFYVEEASEYQGKDGCVYIDSTDTQSISTLGINGICDDTTFAKFSVSGATQQGRKIIIDKIPSPTHDAPGYETDFSISYVNKQSETITKNYHLSREIVSKITFPKNDNLDMTDAKGLQKVHMYGDKSLFKDATNIENFYKLEFNLYDFEGNLIEDTEDVPYKKQAFESLVKEIDQDSGYEYGEVSELHKEGYIKVKFAQKSNYEFEEIYNNKFADKQNKNVTFKLHTHTNTAKAQYTFAVTAGVNAYCEDALTGKVTDNNWTIVLQTNFGKEGATKDNVPFETSDNNWLPNIVGNGYTLNFNAYTNRHAGQPDVRMYIVRAFNTILQGCNQSLLSRDRNLAMFTRENRAGRLSNVTSYLAYNEIKCFSGGIDYNCTEEKVRNHYIKNCVFHDSLDFTLKVQNKIDLTIENSTFYNAGNFVMFVFGNPTIRFKGFVDVNNFHNSEMLSNIMGVDLSFAWNIVLNIAKQEGVVQIGADTRDYINSFICSIFSDEFYFWDQDQGAWVKDEQGHKGGAEFSKKLPGLRLPFVGEITLWSNFSPKQKEHAPDYWKMYDKEGKIMPEFIAAQFEKITRKII